MKKNLCVMTILAVLAVGCVKEQQPEAGNLAEGQKVTTLSVSVDQTKVAVSEIDGLCQWQEGDQIAMWFTTGTETTGEGETAKTVDVGTKVVFTYSKTVEDGRASFITTDEIPAEYTTVKVAHPVDAIMDHGVLQLVKSYVYNVESVPVYVRAESKDLTAENSPITVDEDGNFSTSLTHNASIMKFTLHDIPAYAAGLVVETKRTNGNSIIVTTKFPYKTGYIADPSDNSNDIVLYSPVAHSSYPYQVYLVDGNNNLIEGSNKYFKSTAENLLGYGDYIKMPTIDFNKAELRKDYIMVMGVKWAKGNLCYKSGNSVEGFQPGWGLKANQWDYAGYNVSENTVLNNIYTYDPDKPTEMRVTRNSSEFEHFNWGGIGKWAYDKENYIKPTSTSFDLSGKLYSDESGTTELTGEARFASEGEDAPSIYGDLAFWATKGKFKIPTNAEMKSIHNEGSKIYGWYEADGFKVYGWLIRTPDLGYTRQEDAAANGNRKFTDADLETGIFLVCGGRVANSNSDCVIGQRTEGEYRNATFIKKVAEGAEIYSGKTAERDMYYAQYYGMPSTSVAKIYTNIGAKERPGNKGNDAFDAAAGFMIRPVLAE